MVLDNGHRMTAVWREKDLGLNEAKPREAAGR
jgi:hypothetical protein